MPSAKLIETSNFINLASTDYVGSSPSNTTPTTDDILVADTEATGTFVVVNASVVNRKLTTKPIPVQVATGSVIYSTHTAKLPILSLPLAA